VRAYWLDLNFGKKKPVKVTKRKTNTGTGYLSRWQRPAGCTDAAPRQDKQQTAIFHGGNGISEALIDIEIDHADQTEESDMSFLTRMAEMLGASLIIGFRS
jgi:hypothetical protein